MHVYSYCVNGKEYQIKSTALNPNSPNVGDRCTIWYNPAKPQVAQEFRYDTSKVYTIILICGIVIVVIGLALPFIGLAVQN